MRKYNFINLFHIEWVKIDSGGGTTPVFAEDAEDAIKKFYDYWGKSADRIVHKIELIETYYKK